MGRPRLPGSGSKHFGRKPNHDDNGLTPRQVDVLRGITAGRTQKEIASDLGVSAKTIGTHAMNLCAVIGVHTTRQAAAWGWKHGYGDYE